MYRQIEERVIAVADYVINTGSTVRQTAEVFGVGKSTVHKDLRERLRYLDKRRFHLVEQVLGYNLSQRHLRGGMATKNKYSNRQRQ